MSLRGFLLVILTALASSACAADDELSDAAAGGEVTVTWKSELAWDPNDGEASVFGSYSVNSDGSATLDLGITTDIDLFAEGEAFFDQVPTAEEITELEVRVGDHLVEPVAWPTGLLSTSNETAYATYELPVVGSEELDGGMTVSFTFRGECYGLRWP